MKEKYIEERFPRWWAYPNSNDIETINYDAGTAINTFNAECLIKKHNELLDAFISLAQKFDEASPNDFKKYWYGE